MINADQSKEFVSRIRKCQEGMIVEPIDAIDDIIERVYFGRKKRNIRDLTISSDERYLITCSEIWEEEGVKILLWDIETGDITTLGIQNTKSNQTIKGNWLLCIDDAFIEVNGQKFWIICAGSRRGDLFAWFGKIDPVSGNWGIKENHYQTACFSQNAKEVEENSISAIKITTDNNTITIYTGGKDAEIRAWDVYLDPNTIDLIINSVNIIKGQETHEKWIMALDLSSDNQFLFSGSADQKIIKWNLREGTNIIIGEHNTAITELKLSENDDKLVVSSRNHTIRIWDLKTPSSKAVSYGYRFDELVGHKDAVFSIELMKFGAYLISASIDDTIKFWDLENGACIRNIPIPITELQELDYVEFDYRADEAHELGGTFVRKVKISPDNRYIFAVISNKILKIRNQGMVWHFVKQLNFIKESDNDTYRQLYEKIYGENLKQIAIHSPENRTTLIYLYNLIMDRLKRVNEKLRTYTPEYNHRILAPLFISSFLKLAPEKLQKEYGTSIKTKYDAYWNSVKDLFHVVPNLRWGFRLFLTPEPAMLRFEESLKNATYFEISKPLDHIFIILKSRHQTALNFALTLENFPASFIPLLDSIIIIIEDDRGNISDLRFTDFIYPYPDKFNIKLDKRWELKEDGKKSKKSNIVAEPIEHFYSLSTFKLDEGYNMAKVANLKVKKITLEITENLDPFRNEKSKPNQIGILEAFRNTVKFPVIPPIQLKMGEGAINSIGRSMDDFLAKIVMIGLFGTFLDLFAVSLLQTIIPDIYPWIVFTISMIGFVSIGITMIWMVKSREKS